MAVPLQQLGFREVIPDQSALIQWRSIVIDTGAAQSTLQDIKVPEYGGGYAYKLGSAVTRNRYIYWRVCHDIVELWEESLDYDLIRNHVQLRFADTPILEGLSIHETNHHVIILLATVSSVHRIRLPHPQSYVSRASSIFSDLTFQTLKDHHNLHLLNNSVSGNVGGSGEGLPHTAGTHLVSSSNESSASGCGDAIFILGLAGGALMVVRMTDLPYSVHTHAIKNASLMNRLFTGFVPGMFRGMEGGETVTSLVLVEMGGDVMALGVCRDARIRAWSCTRLECIMAHDSLENTAEAGKKLQPGAQRHLVRSLSEGDGISLGVFLNFAEKQLMLVYNPVVNMGQLSLTHIKTLYPPQYDLVDFSLTSEYIWSLWVDSNNETQLLYASVSDGESGEAPGLSSAVLAAPPDKEVTLTDTTLDPREIYLKQLFTPNLFSAHTIRKALGIYRRNVDFMRLMEGGMKRLQEEVESALRDEVEARMTSDLTDEEVTELTLEAWANFYCHTLQYHQVGQKAVGLVGVGGLGLVGVVRKQCVSWMRPMDALEVLALAPLGSSTLTHLAQQPILSEDGAVMTAAVGLAGPLRCIRQALAPEVAAAFTLDLLHLEPPDQVAGAIVMSLLSDGEIWADGGSLSSTLGQQLASIAGGLVPGIRAYLDALQIDRGMPDALSMNGASNPGIPDWVSLSLGGQVGSSIIGAVVAQFARVRLELCRDLLLLQHIALQLGTQCRLTPENSAQLRSTLVPKTSMLTQAYFALLHIATTPAVRPASHTLEVSRRQLAALSLEDSPSLPPGIPGGRPQLVLELLVAGSSGSNIRALVASCLEGDNIPQSWAALLPPLAATVAQFAWPISHCLALPEFLVWCGQHGAVQEYVRLLQPWCEWNSCSRKFLLAVALLNQGEPDKAARLFLQAIEGVTTEDFLGVKVCGGSPDSSPDQLRVQYCLRVIRLLEQSGQTALALQVAGEGVSMAGADDPACSALYSVVFKHHLELSHHDEAFTAMLACPDDHRRRNCLRQLIVSLHERKCLNLLVNYQYGHLEPEVINILENRARSADILVNNYYDLLFAFHVKKHNFKKAACVMYECAMRLNVEGMGEIGLRQQAKCYLACLNCLRHIQSEQAWIVKPLPTAAQGAPDENVLGFGVSPKRSSDGAVLAAPLARRRAQVHVLEVKDLEKEYQVVHARLKLFKMKQQQALQHQNSGSGPMSPADTISLLTHGKLFRDALRLSNLFDLEVSPVLEGLANACIAADQSLDKISQWEWLAENGVQKDHTDSSQWWLLLKELLQEQEKGGQSHLHCNVTTTLLNHSNTLPTWLIHSYKKRNAAELLRLYVSQGLLEDAVRLSCEYIDGLLGVANDQVGLANPLQANAAPVWMPYTALDKLLLELKEVQSNTYFKQLHDTLDCKLKVYQEELHRVSADRLIFLQG